jgi:hypothetical protein
MVHLFCFVLRSEHGTEEKKESYSAPEYLFRLTLWLYLKRSRYLAFADLRHN